MQSSRERGLQKKSHTSRGKRACPVGIWGRVSMGASINSNDGPGDVASFIAPAEAPLPGHRRDLRGSGVR